MHLRSIFEFLSPPHGLALALLALLAAPLHAQDDDWYQIEVLVFDQSGGPHSDNRQLGLQLAYPDNWRQLTDPDAPTPPWLDESPAEVPETSAVDIAEELAGEAPPPEEAPYTLLPSSERRLNGEARSLERASGYRVLYHQAWRQPLASRAAADWILVRGGDQYGDHQELEGALRVYLQRALFAQTRLWHARFSPASGQRQNAAEDDQEPLILPAWPARFGGETPMFERLARESSQQMEGHPPLPRSPSDTQDSWAPGEAAPALYETDRIAALEQTRRLELGTTLYLDHPELGVLVHVTRYQRDALEETLDDTAPDENAP